jgi:hypothetical protein
MKKLKCLFSILIVCFVALNAAYAQKRPVVLFLDIKETNHHQASTVGTNTLIDLLKEAGMKIAAKRKDATVVISGTMEARAGAVTDDAKAQGGVNADATASVKLLSGAEVIASSVIRSAPGDWGVSADRVGEDRLLEVAKLVAEDLLDSNFVKEVIGPVADHGSAGKGEAKSTAKSATVKNKPARKPAVKRGVSYLEVVSLLQSYVPEDRIAGAVKKYGIKFKANEAAISSLRSAGASEMVISAIRSSAG